MLARKTDVEVYFLRKAADGVFEIPKGSEPIFGYCRTTTYNQFYQYDETGLNPSLQITVNRNCLAEFTGKPSIYNTFAPLYLGIGGDLLENRAIYKVVRIYERDMEFTELYCAAVEHCEVRDVR